MVLCPDSRFYKTGYKSRKLWKVTVHSIFTYHAQNQPVLLDTCEKTIRDLLKWRR